MSDFFDDHDTATVAAAPPAQKAGGFFDEHDTAPAPPSKWDQYKKNVGEAWDSSAENFSRSKT